MNVKRINVIHRNVDRLGCDNCTEIKNHMYILNTPETFFTKNDCKTVEVFISFWTSDSCK